MYLPWVSEETAICHRAGGHWSEGKLLVVRCMWLRKECICRCSMAITLSGCAGWFAYAAVTQGPRARGLFTNAGSSSTGALDVTVRGSRTTPCSPFSFPLWPWTLRILMKTIITMIKMAISLCWWQDDDDDKDAAVWKLTIFLFCLAVSHSILASSPLPPPPPPLYVMHMNTQAPLLSFERNPGYLFIYKYMQEPSSFSASRRM